jgi:hypothetical protein
MTFRYIVDPRMKRLIGGMGSPIIPIVRYFRIMYVYIYIYRLKSRPNRYTVLYI